LNFDWSASKEVPVQPRVLGLDPAARTTVRVEPSTALIMGPQGQIQNVHFVLTDAIDAAGITGETIFSGIHIFVTDPMVRVARPLAVSVTVAPEAQRNRLAPRFSAPGGR
jgi:hypothetical protein